MNFNKKKSSLIPFVIIFCVCYIVLAVRISSPEIHFTPEWTKDIFDIQENSENEQLIPFRLSQNIGYFTSSGKIVSSTTFPFKSTISEKWYATYGADNSSLDFFFADGTKAGTINEFGFPFFDGNRIYIILPGGTSFVRCDEDGNRLWKYERLCPITAFASNENGTVAGYADGVLISWTKNGQVDQKFSPGGSNIEVILGTDISSNGKKVACVSGQDKQRFLVAQKFNGHSKVIYHEYLNDSVINQTIVKFNEKSDIVYYNGKDFLGIVNLNKSKSKKIPIKGKISQIEFSDDNLLTFVLSKDENVYTVTVLESYVDKIAAFSFKGECAFIQTQGKDLFIGRNNKISKISVSKK